MLGSPTSLHPHRLSLAALALVILAGCSTKVTGGGDGEGRGGDGGSVSEGGSGGNGGVASASEDCEEYIGPCQPGETLECGWAPTTTYCSVGPNCTTEWAPCNTPLVLSFDGAPVEFRAGDQATFDIAGNISIVTDWPTARTPWLALDLDGDGRITDGRELFGSMTRLPDGRTAAHGFEALRALDENGDGRIDARDPGFARLLLWGDTDGDRVSAPPELSPASASLVSIDLAYRVEPRCDARGNCGVERAAFRFRAASGVERTGAVIDVHLRAQR